MIRPGIIFITALVLTVIAGCSKSSFTYIVKNTSSSLELTYEDPENGIVSTITGGKSFQVNYKIEEDRIPGDLVLCARILVDEGAFAVLQIFNDDRLKNMMTVSEPFVQECINYRPR